MFLSTAHAESFGVMYLELLCSGVVGVFTHSEWIDSLLPEYPFRTTAKNVPAMMASIYRDYDRAVEYLRREAVPTIRKTFNIDKSCEALRQLFEE